MFTAPLRIRLPIAFLLAIVPLAVCGSGEGQSQPARPGGMTSGTSTKYLRVMSFNVAHTKFDYWAEEMTFDATSYEFESRRVGSVPSDKVAAGAHVVSRVNGTKLHVFWFSKRAWNVHRAIEAMEPDVLGLQEAFYEQAKIIAHALGLHSYARGREEHPHADETNAILWNPARVTVQTRGTLNVASGSIPLPAQDTFWYSNNPDDPGSIPENAQPWGKPNMERICSWVEFKKNDTNQGFYHFNTHLQHNDGAQNADRNRMRQVELLIDRIGDRDHKSLPVLVTGDFNATPSDDPIKQMTTGSVSFESRNWDNASPFIDTFVAAVPPPPPGGTKINSDGSISKRRIDYVFVSPGVKVVQAGIQSNPPGPGRTSDHLAVFAVVHLP